MIWEEVQVFMMNQKRFLGMFPDLRKANLKMRIHSVAEEVLANMKIRSQKRNKIAQDAAAELTKGNPDILATACPLCKKTFAQLLKQELQIFLRLLLKHWLFHPVKKSIRTKIFSGKELAGIC